MSFFGDLLKIVAIGAFFIATGPFGLAVGPTLATALRIGGVVLGYLGALIDRPRLMYEKQRHDLALDPGYPLPVVYGRAKVGGVVADWFTDPDNSDNILYMVVAFAHGSRDGSGIEAVEEIWLNHSRAVVTSGPTYEHPYNALVVDYQVFLGSTAQNVGGTQLTGLLTRITDKALYQVTDSNWSATTDTGKGVACVAFRFLNVIQDQERGPIFRGPPTVAFIVTGSRVYDTRTDTWVPGGDNPAMCIRDFLLATIPGCGFAATYIHEGSFETAADYCDDLISHGVGSPFTITSSDAGTDRVTTSAPHGFEAGDRVRIAGHSGATPALNGDHAAITVTTATSFTIDGVDITVGGTGGTVLKLVQTKRYTCNGVVDTARPTADNLQELLSSCRGNLVWEQGQFKLTIRSEEVASPTLTLSPDNIIGEWSFRNAGLEDKWNSARATYLEPANGEFKVQEVQWPRVGTANAYLAADNDFVNVLDLALPFTNDQLMAQMIAQITLNEARKGIGCSVLCTEEVLAASVGDRVKVTHPTPGWTDKEFWVMAMTLLPNMTVQVALQEYDATSYDLATQDDRRSFAATDHPSVFDVPGPGVVSLSSLTPQGVKIAWEVANYSLIDFYEVQARFTSGGEDYVTIERVREGGALEAIAPLARPGQTWDARVRVVNVVGWPSDWVDASQLSIPVPATLTPLTGALVVTGFAPTVVIPPIAPTLNSATRSQILSGDACTFDDPWTHRIEWDTTGADDVNFQVNIDVANDSAGTSYTGLVTGLTTADSSYDNDTGVAGNTGGSSDPLTYYRKYKVKIVRKSDSVVTSSMETSQGTLTVYSDECPL